MSIQILIAKFVCITHSSKNFMEFHKFFCLINVKNIKIFWNVKIQWISMFFFEKKLYRTFLFVRVNVMFIKLPMMVRLVVNLLQRMF